MKTRKEYMQTLPKYGTRESTAHHRAYYAQFVTPGVRSLVKSRFGVERLTASRDEHFNDIPLAEWDSFWVRYANRGMYIEPGLTVSALIRQAGEDFSASTGTCILKEAARQIVEEASR